MSGKKKPSRNRGLEDSGELLFSWGLRRLRRWSLIFFILASLAVHAFGLYLFRVVQPEGDGRAESAPQAITLLTGDSEETAELLRDISARSGGFRGSLKEVPLRLAMGEYGGEFESQVMAYEPTLLPWVAEEVGAEYPRVGQVGKVVLPALRREVVERAEPPLGGDRRRMVPQFQFTSEKIAERSPSLVSAFGKRFRPDEGEMPSVRLYLGVGRDGRVRVCLPAEESNRRLAAEASRYIEGRQFVPDPSAEAVEWTWVDVVWKIAESGAKANEQGGRSS